MGKIEEWIKAAERIVIVFHIDTDGICSGVLTYHLVKKLGNDIIAAVPCVPTLPNSAIKSIIRHEPSLVIFVDLGIDQEPEKVKSIADNRRVILIDHHQVHNDMNSSNIIHMNPMFDSERYCPASKYVYDLFKMRKFDWIAAAGILGDSGVSEWEDFIEKIKKRYKVAGDIRKSVIGRIDELLASGRIIEDSDGALAAFETLKNSSTADEFLSKAGQLNNWRERVSKELKRIMSDFNKSREAVDDILFYEARSQMNIASVLATVLSIKYPKKTLFVYNAMDNVVKVHLRRNDGKMNMGELVRRAASGFKNSASGGHRNAAGGHVLRDDFEAFKTTFIEQYHKIK